MEIGESLRNISMSKSVGFVRELRERVAGHLHTICTKIIRCNRAIDENQSHQFRAALKLIISNFIPPTPRL